MKDLRFNEYELKDDYFVIGKELYPTHNAGKSDYDDRIKGPMTDVVINFYKNKPEGVVGDILKVYDDRLQLIIFEKKNAPKTYCIYYLNGSERIWKVFWTFVEDCLDDNGIMEEPKTIAEYLTEDGIKLKTAKQIVKDITELEKKGYHCEVYSEATNDDDWNYTNLIME